MSAPLLPTLPTASGRRLAVRVSRDAERQLRGGHPWVFAPSIRSVSHDAAPGDLAVVFDHRRRFIAIGLWDPASPIRLRVLHHGSPTTIDEGWWDRTIAAAVDARMPLAQAGHTGYRLVHGENDGLPGLVVDRYDTTLVVKLYSEALFAHLDTIVTVLIGRTEVERVVLRLSRNVAVGPTHGLADGDTIVGETPKGPVQFVEHGLAFEADPVRGQKTGHFLDQRDNRHRVAQAARGMRVLDVYCCTGGFSVHAAASGAAAVHLVDQSRPALAAARRNLALNAHRPEIEACATEFSAGDAFAMLDGLAHQSRRYDIVVLDPPAFARRARQEAGALAAYGRLTAAGLAVLADGGLLVQASCSSRISADQFAATVVAAADGVGVALHDVDLTGHPIDHPIGFAQGAYLKALFARVSQPGPTRMS